MQQQQTILNLNNTLFSGLETILRAYGEDVARSLAAKYSFDAEEAIATVMCAPPVLKTEKKAVKAEKPKRGRSAYAFYMADSTVRDGIKAAHPDWTFGDISKAIGDNWKTMDAEARQKYIDQSNAEKAALQTEGPLRVDAPVKAVKKAKSAATSSDEESGDALKPKKVKKPKKSLKVVENSSDDLIASLVAKAQSAAPAPALTIQVQGLDESPMDVVAPVAPAPAVPELSDAEKAAKEEKKRQANEKRKATLAAKKAKKAEEDALAAQMSSMTIHTELTPEPVEAPKVTTPKAPTPKAPTPKAESPKKSGGATKITLEGTTYYNQEGWLYDMQSKECVGFWNGSEIEPVEEESDDEE